jgi:hypothetical protein
VDVTGINANRFIATKAMSITALRAGEKRWGIRIECTIRTNNLACRNAKQSVLTNDWVSAGAYFADVSG